MNKKAILTRIQSDDKQTLGIVAVYQNNIKLFECVSLELPDLNNQRNLSRIPQGKYLCKKRSSPKYGLHFELQEVPNRSLILIHAGNTKDHTKGCLLFGKNFVDINKDGLLDVTASKDTVAKFMKVMEDEDFYIYILDAEF